MDKTHLKNEGNSINYSITPNQLNLRDFNLRSYSKMTHLYMKLQSLLWLPAQSQEHGANTRGPPGPGELYSVNDSEAAPVPLLQFLDDERTDASDWPSRLPDLNPITHLWTHVYPSTCWRPEKHTTRMNVEVSVWFFKQPIMGWWWCWFHWQLFVVYGLLYWTNYTVYS